ncbi:MAG TPA: choice-of-anchor Q domain-containing protein [Thermoleophilaceae bacterium]
MGKGIWPVLAIVGVLLLAPAASAATVRFASPSGDDTTSNCTATEPPCSLRRAVEMVAGPGDEVVATPGTYNLTAQLNVGQDLYIHGQDGQPRPRVVSTAPIVFTFSKYAGGARLSRLQVEAPGQVLDTTLLTDFEPPSMADHLVVLAGPAGSGSAANMAGGWTLQDSVVHTDATNGIAVNTFNGSVRVANVTAIASDAGGVGLVSDSAVGGICIPPYTVDSHAVNVIARGGAYDLKMSFLCNGSQSLDISFSNFRRDKVSAAPAGAHYDDGGGNQDAEPLFAAPAALDFHELAGSPTIDAGGVTPALGATDLDGEPRVQGAAPDIGADETQAPPVPDTTRPVASLLSISPGRFRAAAAAAGAAAKRRAGARISYALDEAATVTFTFKRIVQRVVHHRRRTGYVPLRGSITDAGEVGGNSLRFSGRLRGRRLKRGLYRLIALPVDAAGNTGNAVFIRFRIIR